MKFFVPFIVYDCPAKYSVFKTNSGFIDREVTLEYSTRSASSASLEIVECVEDDPDDTACAEYLGQIEIQLTLDELETVTIG